MKSLQDPDSWLWICFTGLFMLAVATLRLYAGYNQFEIDKDIGTAATVSGAYFVQAIVKKIVRSRQEKNEPD